MNKEEEEKEKEERTRLLKILASKNSILEEAFKAIVLGKNQGLSLSPSQIKFTRQIFNSGFANCLALVLQGPNYLTKQQSLDLLEKLKKDVYDWVNQDEV